MLFDTLKYTKSLIAGGFSQRQVEAQAEALVAVADEHLAIKQDLIPLKQDLSTLKQDLTLLKQELIALELRLENKLTMKLGRFIAISTAILAMLISFHH